MSDCSGQSDDCKYWYEQNAHKRKSISAKNMPPTIAPPMTNTMNPIPTTTVSFIPPFLSHFINNCNGIMNLV